MPTESRLSQCMNVSRPPRLFPEPGTGADSHERSSRRTHFPLAAPGALWEFSSPPQLSVTAACSISWARAGRMEPGFISHPKDGVWAAAGPQAPPSPAPCPEQDRPRLHHPSQGCVQRGLKHLEGRRFHPPSGTLPALPHPPRESFVLMSGLALPTQDWSTDELALLPPHPG